MEAERSLVDDLASIRFAPLGRSEPDFMGIVGYNRGAVIPKVTHDRDELPSL
jgi:hypothetical protein